MKTNFVRAALACAVLMVTATTAIAAIDPIPGVDVIVKKDPNNNALITATSDADGRITLKGLTPGNYEIVIDGQSLIAAMNRLVPPAPEKKSSSSSFSLGFGGFSGGGGSKHASSQQGAGAIGGPAKSSSGTAHADGVSTSGDSGVSVNINQLASDGGQGNGSARFTDRVRLEAEIGWDRHDANGDRPVVQGSKFSVDVPYCRDTAHQGMLIGFTVPEGGGTMNPPVSIQVIMSHADENDTR